MKHAFAPGLITRCISPIVLANIHMVQYAISINHVKGLVGKSNVSAGICMGAPAQIHVSFCQTASDIDHPGQKYLQPLPVLLEGKIDRCITHTASQIQNPLILYRTDLLKNKLVLGCCWRIKGFAVNVFHLICSAQWSWNIASCCCRWVNFSGSIIHFICK